MRLDRVERTALISIAINVGLVFLKVFLAVLSGSLALLADAWHSGSDIVASGLVWAGARISRREGRETLAIVENAIALAIGGLILWAAVGIFRKVSAAASGSIDNLPVAIGGSLVAALVSYYAAQYKLHVGRETGSLSLVADGHHSRMDTLTTGAVVVGLMGHAIGLELDRIAAVVVALFVVESGVVILLAAGAGLRGGTAASAALIQRASSSRAIRGLFVAVERSGLAAAGRAVRRWAATPGRRRSLLSVVAVACLVVWALSCVYFVGPGRVGVVRRWGRALELPAGPGAHLKAPWPIDSVARLEVPRVRRVEIGFSTRSEPRAVTDVAAEFYATLWESRHAAGTYEKRPEEALRLTGDENIVDINAVVLYRVSDPYGYLFRVADAGALVKVAAESVIGETVGSLPIEEILTVKRDSLEILLASSVQGLLDRPGAGVEIVGVRLQDMHPPLEVVPSFRDVGSAREDKNTIINEALAYSNETVPKARGDAERLVQEARAYRSERVDRALGDADRFRALLAEYRKARTVTETRLYIETMEELLQGVEKFIVSAGVELKGYDIRMFDRELGTAARLDQ